LRTPKEPLFITTTDGRFVDLNGAMVQLFGYENKEELMKIKVPKPISTRKTGRSFRR